MSAAQLDAYWERLAEIHNKSMQCERTQADENTWSNTVIRPLLELAAKGSALEVEYM